ncbi:MAG: hypoxanthine phosphoribosyltransferase [Clostridia bacterium]|nr:hypoxanthine phosphoribosyltransferase [Clostridia bacterium]
MKVLIPHEEIVDICKTIGNQLTKKFAGKNPIVSCVLKGAAPFHSELMKHLDMQIEADYIQVKSYVGTQSTGKINIKKDLDFDIAGRDVIIVEDIVDTGTTLSCLKTELEKRNPNSLTFVALLDKPSRRKIEFEADFVGKVIEDLFVVGFGLDYNEQYRNLKDIYILEN